MPYVDPRIKETFRVPQPEGRSKYLRLDQNENVDGIPQWLFDETVSKITPEFLSTYPEETRLTEKYAKMLGLELENATLTDGSVVGMGYAIKVFGEPGKKLLCVTPTFGMYKVYGEMNGMIPVTFPYEKDFSFDLRKMIDSIDKDTGIVVLVNPNMPIGNTYTKEEVESVVRKAKENDALVIVDEAYHYFCEESAVPFVKKYDNVLILRTFSKMLSIPSLRLGAIISSKDNIRYINNYKPHYTVNSVALLFGEAIVDNNDRLVKELKEKFDEGMKYVMDTLSENGYSVIPSSGCFVCIRPKVRDADYITAELKNRGILILNGTGDLKGYIRLTVWGKKHMETFMKAFLDIDKE